MPDDLTFLNNKNNSTKGFTVVTGENNWGIMGRTAQARRSADGVGEGGRHVKMPDDLDFPQQRRDDKIMLAASTDSGAR
ncbi:hypothetical protein U1Q18_030175 [Sarracenia purpurea var. burkii]